MQTEAEAMCSHSPIMTAFPMMPLVGGVGEVVGAPAGALIGGFFGYISGRKVSETVYDVVTQKGMPIGGR